MARRVRVNVFLVRWRNSMSGRKPEVQPLSYRMTGDLQFLATGSHRAGGAVEVFIGDKSAGLFLLPAALFSVFVVLAKAAVSAADGFWGKAFVSTDKLAEDLERLAELGGRDPQLIHRSIYRLRRRLNAAEVRLKLPRSKRAAPLGTRLVELVPFLGYRLSISPNQLGLRLSDDKSDEPLG